jgi:hypothetical protein
MPRKPVVDFRESDTPARAPGEIPEWLPSLIVFLFGLSLFGVIEILIHS